MFINPILFDIYISHEYRQNICYGLHLTHDWSHAHFYAPYFGFGIEFIGENYEHGNQRLCDSDHGRDGMQILYMKNSHESG